MFLQCISQLRWHIGYYVVFSLGFPGVLLSVCGSFFICFAVVLVLLRYHRGTKKNSGSLGIVLVNQVCVIAHSRLCKLCKYLALIQVPAAVISFKCCKTLFHKTKTTVHGPCV